MSGKGKRIATVVAFIAIFVFLSLPVKVSRSVKVTITNFFSPVLSLSRSISDKLRDIWDVTFHSENIIRENIRKERRIQELRAKLALARRGVEELKSFHSQLDEIAKSGLEVIPARVVGREPDSWYRTCLLDRGASHGVRRGMPVTYGENLVGRVVEVGRRWSRVRLILAAGSAIPGVTNDGHVTGVVMGTGPGELKMTYIEQYAKVKVGDVVVTRHLGEVLAEDEAGVPAGLVVGKIASLSQEEQGLYQSAILESPVDFRNLSEVLVVIPK